MKAKSALAEQPRTTAGKRERILRAAVEVFARTGYFNAKVSEIAKAAGVADGTIYLYFDGKEDLLITTFREHTTHFLIGLRQELEGKRDVRDRIRVLVRFHLKRLGSDRQLAVVSQVELRHSLKFMSLFSHEELAEYLALIRSVVEDGQRLSVFRATLPAPMVAKAIFGILDEMVTSWILSEKVYDLAEQSDAVADFILNGLV